ncbi:MAG: 3-dehydroquinate synthase [Oscillospiraceae bacterium]|nr:3-dehydroquinate synthase [Oscillospiraceae bacterium]
MILSVNLPQNGYDVVLEPSALQRADTYLDLQRRVLIVTDDGVPAAYADAVAERCAQPLICRVAQGEDSKSFSVLERLLRQMLAAGFTRKDCVVALGGGVVGDLAGFAASVYMRGVDFYNIPTTMLSQVDSSVGGKTAVNLDGIKNIVGTFYQPKKVLIDPDTLQTLSPRQISEGLAEAVKMSLTSDADLFTYFETAPSPLDRLDWIIERSVRIKADVVARDEKEQGLRRILNFGHTIGHGIESFTHLHGLYHGECVALGMIPMCDPIVRQRLIAVLKKLGLPTSCTLDAEAVYAAMLHDKKSNGAYISVTTVDNVGSYTMREMTPEELLEKLYLIAKGGTAR